MRRGFILEDGRTVCLFRGVGGNSTNDVTVLILGNDAKLEKLSSNNSEDFLRHKRFTRNVGLMSFSFPLLPFLAYEIHYSSTSVVIL